jgi:hypothetical protein
VEAIATIGIGVGLWLMWAAYKGEHPWQLFQNALNPSSSPLSQTPGIVTPGPLAAGTVPGSAAGLTSSAPPLNTLAGEQTVTSQNSY